MTWALFAVLLCAPAGEAMTVTFLEGAARAGDAPLAVGSVLHAGDTVTTEPGGRLEIAIPAGVLIRLGESSRLALSSAVPGKELSARLLLGNLWTRVHRLRAGEAFRIETDNAVAGVRGTEFRLEVAEGAPDLLRVYEGAVQVQAGDGRWSHQVEAGSELRFRRDAGPARAFDPGSEKTNAFMSWVRSRRTRDGLAPGQVRPRELRNPEQEHRQRERIRERRRPR